jgi:raffinose/stachyose/melibiose transport system permease protein
LDSKGPPRSPTLYYKGGKHKVSLYKNKKKIMLYLFPAFAFILVFIYYPIIQNFIYSLYRWSSFSPDKTFIGLENYKRLFTDNVFYISLKNNILYAAISVFFQCGIGLIIAAILEDKVFRKFQGFFRTVYFIPAVISMTVVGLLWQLIYNPSIGIVNSFLNLLGLGKYAHAWLGDPSTAIYAVIFVSQWQYIGYIALLYLIAIQKIPEELYESAVIDGANKIKCFLFITIPQVKEMILVSTVITVIGSFKLFDEIYIMTGGGPGHATEVLATYMYRAAFRNDEMGYAAAFATVIFVITFILTIMQLAISNKDSE